MTTNNEAFDKWLDNTVLVGNPDTVAEWAWQAAKSHFEETWLINNEKKILTLESEVAELHTLCQEYSVKNTELQSKNENYESEVAELKDAKQDLENEVIHLQEMIEPLQASNSNLREAFNDYHLAIRQRALTVDIEQKLLNLLKATPAESLQAHDDELLERAAKVAMDMPMKADEIHEYRFSDDSKAMAWDIFHAIRALKEVK